MSISTKFGHSMSKGSVSGKDFLMLCGIGLNTSIQLDLTMTLWYIINQNQCPICFCYWYLKKNVGWQWNLFWNKNVCNFDHFWAQNFKLSTPRPWAISEKVLIYPLRNWGWGGAVSPLKIGPPSLPEMLRKGFDMVLIKLSFSYFTPFEETFFLLI